MQGNASLKGADAAVPNKDAAGGQSSSKQSSSLVQNAGKTAANDTKQQKTQAQEKQTPSVKNFGAKVAAAQSKEYEKLASGVYTLTSALGKNVDASNAGTANGTNIQAWGNNYTPAQRYRLSTVGQDKNGEWIYVIKSITSNKVLDCANGGKNNGTNVWLWESNGTGAQKWYFRPYKASNGKTYYRIINIASGKALDVSGGSRANGANIQLFQQNGTAAQNWALKLWDAVISNGAYRAETKLNKGYSLEVSGGSGDDTARAQIGKNANALKQEFAFNYQSGTGYYVITSYGSGKVLDVSGGSSDNYTQIQQFGYNGTKAQWWQPVKNADGSYTFFSAVNGGVLDVANGQVSNGNRVWQFQSNGTSAQKFYLEKVSPVFGGGTVRFQNGSNTYLVADIRNASRKSGETVQLFGDNSTMAQKFNVASNGDGTFTIRTIDTGKYLSMASNGNVVQQDANKAYVQKWRIVATSNGHFSIIAFGTNSKLGAASVKQGSGLVAKPNASGASWNFVWTPYLANGLYTISANSNKGLVLDVSNASLSNGANVQLFSSNGTNAQKFYVKHLGGNVYSIRNAWSGAALDVANGNAYAKANVQQFGWNGTNAQKWRADWLSDGSFVFKNQLGNYSLAFNGLKSGGNIELAAYDKSKAAQRFSLTTTSPVRASVSQLIGLLNSVSAGGLSVSYSAKDLSSSAYNQLRSAIASYTNSGYSVGFTLLDVKTGAVISYRPDWWHYSASTIKGPYVAALCKYNPSSLSQMGGTMHDVVNWSSDYGYETLQNRFGNSAFYKLVNETDSWAFNWSYNIYANYSSKTLAKMWVGVADYLSSDQRNADWCRREFGSNVYVNSRRAIGGTVYAKSGWTDYPSTNDEACFVNNGNSSYILTVMSNEYNDNCDSWRMRNLMSALNRAHSELIL